MEQLATIAEFKGIIHKVDSALAKRGGCAKRRANDHK
jgi:hypothetical protein